MKKTLLISAMILLLSLSFADLDYDSWKGFMFHENDYSGKTNESLLESLEKIDAYISEQKRQIEKLIKEDYEEVDVAEAIDALSGASLVTAEKDYNEIIEFTKEKINIYDQMKINNKDSYTEEEKASLSSMIENISTYDNASNLDYGNLTIVGKELKLTSPLLIVNNSTLIPVRAVSETLGFEVSWIEEERKVIIKSSDRTVILIIDSDLANIDANTFKLSTAAKIYFNSTYVPLRFVAEAFDMKVEWDADSRMIIITE